MEELIRTEVKEILSNIIDANFNAISKKQNAKEYVSAIIDEYNTISFSEQLLCSVKIVDNFIDIDIDCINKNLCLFKKCYALASNIYRLDNTSLYAIFYLIIANNILERDIDSFILEYINKRVYFLTGDLNVLNNVLLQISEDHRISHSIVFSEYPDVSFDSPIGSFSLYNPINSFSLYKKYKIIFDYISSSDLYNIEIVKNNKSKNYNNIDLKKYTREYKLEQLLSDTN